MGLQTNCCPEEDELREDQYLREDHLFRVGVVDPVVVDLFQEDRLKVKGYLVVVDLIFVEGWGSMVEHHLVGQVLKDFKV